MNSETKKRQNCQQNFTIEPEDFVFYDKMKVPAPTWCPECRQKRRILFRNFKTLYKRPSSLSNKNMVSMYSPDVLFPVYNQEEWWSDQLSADTYDLSYGPNQLFMVASVYDKKPIVFLMSRS